MTLVAPVGVLGPPEGTVRYGLEFRPNVTALQVPTRELSVERYLDRFWLMLPPGPDERQKLLDGFFNAVAEDYESLIDVPRNVANIRHLLTSLQLRVDIDPNDRVIDFGCGTGLAASVAQEMNVRLIGLDSSENMRRMARARSLATMSPGELARSKKGWFVGAVASYVLHLLPHTKGFELMWSRLAAHAVVVANFHKDHGIDQVVQVIDRTGGMVERIGTDPAHGTYLAMHRSRQR
jgi:SAM-dependent methyltransferase